MSSIIPTKTLAAAVAARPWQDLFLEYYSETFNVGESAKRAGVTRMTYYNYLSKNPAFKAAVEQARLDAVDKLEAAAWSRATVGVEDVVPVWYKGVKVGDKIVRKFSDGLAEFLLKAHRPELYDRAQKVEHSGTVNVTNERVSMLTDMVQKQINAGYSLEAALNNLVQYGVPGDELRLIKAEALQLREGEDYSVVNDDSEIEEEEDDLVS